MPFGTRITFLLLGCVIGFIAGYVVRSLREIKSRVEEVDEHVTNKKATDKGFAENSWLTNVALFLTLAITVYAAFSSQHASNGVKNAQTRLDRVSSCNQEFLTKTIAALNARTQYSQEQADANITLQKAQSEFLGVVIHPKPTPDTANTVALQKYYAALTNFIVVSTKTSNTISANAYPTTEELASCLRGK